MSEYRVHSAALAGDPFTAETEVHTPCFHCLDTGWVMLTAENDYGELEDYFVLCRRCKGKATIRGRF